VSVWVWSGALSCSVEDTHQRAVLREPARSRARLRHQSTWTCRHKGVLWKHFSTLSQARCQKLNKEKAIPPILLPFLPFPSVFFPPHFTPFPLSRTPVPRLRLVGLGERLRSTGGSGWSPATKRISALENASADKLVRSEAMWRLANKL